jgi:predicted glycoside hydrolase/deacetylase ChbG (UPF0249 family)
MKYLIVNADDFGYSRGINRGIAETHLRGVLTSTSLMVNTVATEEAVRMAADLPNLSIGLHVNFTNEAQALIDLGSPDACRDELHRQFDRFVHFLGRLPTHVDSHQHVHRKPVCLAFFRALAEQHGLPLRDHGPVQYVGGFYAQWEYGVSHPAHVSLKALQRILANEVMDGVTEIGCHPGYRDPAIQFVYDRDREYEIQTLCDPRLRDILKQSSVALIGYHQLPAALAALTRP